MWSGIYIILSLRWRNGKTTFYNDFTVSITFCERNLWSVYWEESGTSFLNGFIAFLSLFDSFPLPLPPPPPSLETLICPFFLCFWSLSLSGQFCIVFYESLCISSWSFIAREIGKHFKLQGSKLSLFFGEPKCIFKGFLKVCIETSTSFGSLQKFEGAAGEFKRAIGSRHPLISSPALCWYSSLILQFSLCILFSYYLKDL